MNRPTEIILAAFLAAALLPLMAVIAGLILLLEGRPVIYVAQRMNGPRSTFGMFKFRTMSKAANRGVTGGDKARAITPLGRILRLWRLDELPQIFNVLRGDMAFVGPRPPAPEYVRVAPTLYEQVLRMRPGITGLATLTGHRREGLLLAGAATPHEVDALYRRRCMGWKARVDLIYGRNRSAMTDIWLIVLTALWVLGFGTTGRLPRPRPAQRPRTAPTIRKRALA